jgi:phospholipid/cholesterol/gamma-HCH transport system permease protein
MVILPLTRYVWTQTMGKLVVWVGLVGEWTLLLGQTSGYVPVGRWLKPVMQQAAVIGWNTLWMGSLMSTCFGMVIALQVAKEMAQQGAGPFVGAMVSLAIVRELGPLMTGFSGIAIAGSAFTSELCTMRLTQQMDALHIMRVSPLRYLALPRLLAAVVMLPIVNSLVVILGVLGGGLVACRYVPWAMYIESVLNNTTLADLGVSTFKATVFAVLLAVIALHTGLTARGTSAQMVTMTTQAVVRSFIACAIADYVISAVMYRV